MDDRITEIRANLAAALKGTCQADLLEAIIPIVDTCDVPSMVATEHGRWSYTMGYLTSFIVMENASAQDAEPGPLSEAGVDELLVNVNSSVIRKCLERREQARKPDCWVCEGTGLVEATHCASCDGTGKYSDPFDRPAEARPVTS